MKDRIDELIVANLKASNREKVIWLRAIKNIALGIAKSKVRDVCNEDYTAAIKSYNKKLLQSKEFGMDVDDEIKFVSQFLPKMISTEDTLIVIDKGIIELGDNVNFKSLLDYVKSKLDIKLLDMKFVVMTIKSKLG